MTMQAEVSGSAGEKKRERGEECDGLITLAIPQPTKGYSNNGGRLKCEACVGVCVGREVRRGFLPT